MGEGNQKSKDGEKDQMGGAQTPLSNLKAALCHNTLKHTGKVFSNIFCKLRSYFNNWPIKLNFYLGNTLQLRLMPLALLCPPLPSCIQSGLYLQKRKEKRHGGKAFATHKRVALIQGAARGTRQARMATLL